MCLSAGWGGLVRRGENAEFLELLASAYQRFFETKRTLFLETRLVGCCLSLGRRQRRNWRGGSSIGFGLRAWLEIVPEIYLSARSRLELNITALRDKTDGRDEKCRVLLPHCHLLLSLKQNNMYGAVYIVLIFIKIKFSLHSFMRFVNILQL